MDLPRNRFKRIMTSGEARYGLWLGLPDTTAAEIAAGAGFDWLLIEHCSGAVSLIESVATDRAEAPGVPLLNRDEPAQGLEANLQRLALWLPLAIEDECLTDARVVVGHVIFKPRPLFRGAIVPAVDKFFR